MHQPLGLYFSPSPLKNAVILFFFFLPKECRPQQTYQSSWRNQSRPVAFCAVGLFVNLLSVVPWQSLCMIARTLEVLAFGEVIVCTLKYVFPYAIRTAPFCYSISVVILWKLCNLIIFIILFLSVSPSIYLSIHLHTYLKVHTNRCHSARWQQVR